MFEKQDVRDYMGYSQPEGEIKGFYIKGFPRKYRRKLELIAIELGKHEEGKNFQISLWVKTAIKYFIDECEKEGVI